MKTARVSRAGATLAELLVALTLAAVVLGTAAVSVLRQHRTARSVVGSAATDAQLRAATGAIAAEIAVLSAGAGDVAGGQARDTTLQLRAMVAVGVSCDDGVGSTTFAPDENDVPEALSGAVPHVGDSLWWNDGDLAAGWRAARIVASDSVTVGCLLTGSAPQPRRRLIVAAAGDTIPLGSHLRVTRPARYSFYKAGDGSWQLGVRDWMGGDAFAPPQPIAGPFLLRSGNRRSGFRYFDRQGDELVAGASGAAADQVARIRVTVIAAGGPVSGGSAAARAESVDVALLPARLP